MLLVHGRGIYIVTQTYISYIYVINSKFGTLFLLNSLLKATSLQIFTAVGPIMTLKSYCHDSDNAYYYVYGYHKFLIITQQYIIDILILSKDIGVTT